MPDKKPFEGVSFVETLYKTMPGLHNYVAKHEHLKALLDLDIANQKFVTSSQTDPKAVLRGPWKKLTSFLSKPVAFAAVPAAIAIGIGAGPIVAVGVGAFALASAVGVQLPRHSTPKDQQAKRAEECISNCVRALVLTDEYGDTIAKSILDCQDKEIQANLVDLVDGVFRHIDQLQEIAPRKVLKDKTDDIKLINRLGRKIRSEISIKLDDKVDTSQIPISKEALRDIFKHYGIEPTGKSTGGPDIAR